MIFILNNKGSLVLQNRHCVEKAGDQVVDPALPPIIKWHDLEHAKAHKSSAPDFLYYNMIELD